MPSAIQPLARRQVVRPCAPVGHFVRPSLAEPRKVLVRGMRGFRELGRGEAKTAPLLQAAGYTSHGGIAPDSMRFATNLSQDQSRTKGRLRPWTRHACKVDPMIALSRPVGAESKTCLVKQASPLLKTASRKDHVIEGSSGKREAGE
jgi:hypothetical protein